jgi:hypothetical protein
VTRSLAILAILVLVAFVQCAGACTLSACEKPAEEKPAQKVPPCHQKSHTPELKPGCTEKLTAAETKQAIDPQFAIVENAAPAEIIQLVLAPPTIATQALDSGPPATASPLRI